MLVQDVMQQPARAVAAGTTLSTAYQIMRTHHIRHLPVVENGRVVGIVTDRDLRFATSALHPTPFPADASVEQVMTRNPLTATPRDPVEEAARLMRAHKVGCLPVVEGDTLTGIVTVSDLLDAIIRLTGVARPGGRLAVRLDDNPGGLASLTAHLAGARVNIHAILSYPADETGTQVILRLDTLNTQTLAETLRREGFDITWPPEKPWSR